MRQRRECVFGLRRQIDIRPPFTEFIYKEKQRDAVHPTVRKISFSRDVLGKARNGNTYNFYLSIYNGDFAFICATFTIAVDEQEHSEFIV